MNNYMKEVAKMLDVELDEEFEIVIPNSNTYTNAKITNDGLIFVQYDIYKYCCVVTLEHLLKGMYTIKHIPWKPKLNERYCSIGIGGCLEYGTWMNDYIDVTLYKLGNCYRTIEEAETNIDKWIKFYNSYEIIDI